MNGFLGEEGTFGYLAQSAGGVRKQAKYIKAANPVRSFLFRNSVFEIPENLCTPARNHLQSLTNRIVKTVFENSKFLPLKIAFKNFVTIEVYMDEIFRRQFSMVKFSNSQKPFLPFDS